MNVSIAAAYAEACRALGESLVRERFLLQRVEALEGEVARLNATESEDT